MLRHVILLLVFFLPAAAQTAYYPFQVDQDVLSGAPDFGSLNHPLGPEDRVFVRDGHFFRVGPDLKPSTGDDERVTFFGVNLAFGANFPEEKDAPRIAKRLRRLGVNLVRLHHMDSQPDSSAANAGSILMAAPYPTLNGVAVQRLRTFLNALAAEGVYCNLNLHVGYTFNPARDGIPALPAAASIPSQSKPLHIFYPRMIELQTDFTRRVIDGLALRNDPALAMVEIDNESSLLQQWQWAQLDQYLAGEYRDVMAAKWNGFLKNKYETTDKLREAWSGGASAGPELLSGNWRLEIHSPSQAVMSQSDGSATVQVTRAGAVVIVKQVGFSVSQNETYLAEVEMRAELPAGQSRNVYWDVKQDVSPWRTETGKNIAVTNQWQRYTMLFKPSFDMDGIGRFGLSVEAVDAPLYIRGATVRIAARRGMLEGESVEEGNVSLVGDNEFAAAARTNDYIAFLTQMDKSYLDTMLAAVRETTDEWTPVAGTQMGYGGLMNLESHASLDYQDNHFYIDHYNFPNVSWDGRDWRFRDSSSLGAGLTTFLNMAAARQGGRPYTVSEYNQPWPNTYAAEIEPTLAVFGAFQDWDSIMHFAYSHGRGWDDGVPNGFNINGDWTKFPNIGQSAWLFRSGAIRPGLEPVDIPVTADMRVRATSEKRNGNIAQFLTAALGFDPAVALVHPVRLAVDAAVELPDAAKSASAPYRADSDEFSFDKDRKLFLIHADGAAGVCGFLKRDEPVEAGALKVEPGESARGYVAMLLTPLDGRPIRESERLLLSNPGYALRSQPGSNPARPQALIKYPNTTDWWTIEPEPSYPAKPSGNLNGGIRPVWMERVEAFVTIRTSSTSITVYPLDGAGQRLDALDENRVQKVEGGFRIHVQANGDNWSPWYEIVR